MTEPTAPLPLFTYGTLLDETFTGYMLERPVHGEPARLLGFELVRLPRLDYPVVSAAPGKSVRGRLYRHLSAGDYVRLDAYEGVGEGLYQRIAGEVVAGEPETPAGTPEQAFVYVPTQHTLGRYG